MVVTVPVADDARCFQPFVHNVVRKLRYRSSLVKADQCIVAIATPKSRQTDKP